MRAVVTGGAGFIGSHLVDALIESGWQVVAFDNLSSGNIGNLARHLNNSRFHFVEADICDNCSIDGSVDLVLNFASPASPPHFLARPLDTLEVGSRGMRNIIEFAISKNARLLQASTSEIYGEPQIHPQAEGYWGNVNPIGPRSVYDESKRYAEALVAAYVRLGQLNASIVRIFNTYGPRLHSSDGRVVSNFIYQSLSGGPLTVYGSGHQTRSFCYVDDLVRAILMLANQSAQLGPVNLGNPEEVTILELANTISELTGTDVLLVHRPLPEDDPTQRKPEIARARRLLGWEPQVGLREGLQRTIEWAQHSIQAHLSDIELAATHERIHNVE